MKKGNLALIIIGAIALVAVVLWYLASRYNLIIDTESAQQEITYNNSSADLITVEAPLPGATVGRSFSITGKARGYWFFEASFPIQIVGQNGEVLATTIAQAQSEWMTEDFVPFKAEADIPTNYTGPAALILKKDNPSGMPQNDASISLPVTIE